VLVRYASNGALDSSFGSGGVVTTDFGGTRDEAWAVAVQHDGKIVVVGHRFPGATGDGPADFAVARYDPAGNLDRAFGADGRVVTDLGAFDLVTGAVLQPDGKIVVAGSTGEGFPELAPTKIALVRFTTTGSLDRSFSGDGRVVTDTATPEAAQGIAIQADGKLVVSSGLEERFAVVWYRSNGQLDATFGSRGFAVAQLPTMQPIPRMAIAAYRATTVVVAGSAQHPVHDE
jgi:uncharacterized delta-60 repeat protein